MESAEAEADQWIADAPKETTTPPPLLPHLSSFAVNSVDFLAVRLLSHADEDVAAASLLSSSFLRRLAIAASLLSGSFLCWLAIAAILKIQRCRCRSPPSSSSTIQSPLLALLQRCLFSLPHVSVTVFSDPRGSVAECRPCFLSLSLAPWSLPPTLPLSYCSSFRLPTTRPPSPSSLTSAPLLPPPFAIAASQSSVPIRFTSEPDGLTDSRMNRTG